ncbi:MAG: rod shape-determining protein RodA [Clostridia bacterium]|nr:rod shape-determining protein RodA [Clostridia bacterium]
MKVIDGKMLKHLDWVTVIIVLTLFIIGIVSIASIMASPFSGTESNMSDYMEKLNLQYVERQLVNFAVGLAVLMVTLIIDYNALKGLVNYAYFAFIGLLLILVVVGKTSRGVAGWFVLENLDRAIQPAELCKVVLIVMFAKLIDRGVNKNGKLTELKDIMLVVGSCLLPALLVFAQPDFGTGFVFICILILTLFCAGVPWKFIIITGVVALVAAPLIYMFVLSPDQKNRIMVFLNPELDPLGSGYNVIQSKLSIGSGMLKGKGYFTEGTLAQLRYVPERHTDFIFSGIIEGLGFIGGTIIILLYFALMFRWLMIAYKAGNTFGMCIVIGCAAFILAHVFENIGMTMGLMPVTGIPLPFISYGGSNLIACMAAVGLVLNVYMRRPLERRAGQY